MPVTLLKKGSLLLIEGIDSSRPAEYIGESASPNVQNFFVDRAILTKRAGTTALGAALANSCMYGLEFVREGTNYNVRIGKTKTEYYNTGGPSWDNIGHADYTGDDDDMFDTAIPLLSGKQLLVITNGVDVMRKWTGTGNTAALGGTPPIAKYIQEYQSYLVAANVQGGTDIDTRVQWSDTANPENWSTGNAGTRDLVEDGGAITGLSLFGNNLVVHKQTSIYLGYLVSTSAIFRFERKATGVGTCANNSIVNLPTGEQIFLANDGLRIFNGMTAPTIDSPVNDEIRDGINVGFRHRAWGLLVRELDEVWIGVPIGEQTSGVTVYRFNYVTRKLYKDIRLLANFAWQASRANSVTWDSIATSWDEQTDRWNETDLSSLVQLTYIGHTSGAVTYVDNVVSSDAGVAIDALWETKDFESEDKRLCRWQQIEIWARGGSVEIDYSTDEGLTWTAVYGSPLALTDTFPTDYSPAIAYFDVVSSKIRFRFRNKELAQALAIKQFIIGYKPREQRR